MKHLTILCALLFAFSQANAQYISNKNDFSTEKSALPVIYISDNINIHFRSPEPIQFIDLSTIDLIGDIPTDNVGRVKIANDTLSKNLNDSSSIGIVTIVGESYMAQYNVQYSTLGHKVNTDIEILPKHMRDLDYPKFEMTQSEFKRISLDILKSKTGKHIKKAKNLKMQLFVNQIYTVGNYIFVDIHFKNKTKIRYDIDKMLFSIEDKKIYKSANSQSIYIEPVFQMYDVPYFQKKHRNVFVFEKVTFPNNKVFRIRSTENQISGRTIQIDLKYRDLLNADTL